MRMTFALAALLLAALPAPRGGAPALAEQPADAPDDAALERRRLARDRAEARERIRVRTDDANATVVSRYDVAGAVAEMLVPNIRPVPILRDGRGMPLEVDLAAGAETPEQWVGAARFAALPPDARAALQHWRGETFGPACNAEFRARFAEHLRRRLNGFGQLREAYIFLAARTPYWRSYPVPLQPTGHWRQDRPMVSRLVAFDGDTRRPPVRWSADFESIEADLVRWTRRSRTGRLAQRAMDDFWRETGPGLGSDAQACPGTAARRPAIEARIMAALDARASVGSE